MNKKARAPKRSILFIHAPYKGQFFTLHQELNRSGLANSYYLCTEGDRRAHQFDAMGDNVVSYAPDGQKNDATAYFFSSNVEQWMRDGRGIYDAVKAMRQKVHLDLVVAHAIGGMPHFLFDDPTLPIVSYIEFPSFRLHGNDPEFPPHEQQIMLDKNLEMLSLYQAHKSALVITPSEYAKRMFPESLHPRIAAQMEGFRKEDLALRNAEPMLKKEPGAFYLGFTARSIGSEKGFHHFAKVAKALQKKHPHVRIVVVGDPEAFAYGYDQQAMKQRFGEGKRSTYFHFALRREEIDDRTIIHYRSLPKADFSTLIREIDLFLYPLQFGSANWGLFECLLRGALVIGSDRCFLPEVIEDGVNGFLRPYGDIDAWVDLADKIVREPQAFARVRKTAESRGRAFLVENVAPKYMALFERALTSSYR